MIITKNNRKNAIQLQTEANLWKIHANIWTKFNTFIKKNKIKDIINNGPFILNELVESIDDIIDLETIIIKTK